MLTIYVSESRVLIEETLLEEFPEELEEVYYRKNFTEFLTELQRKNNTDLFGQKKIIVLRGLEDLKEKEAETLAFYLNNSPNRFLILSQKEPTLLLQALKKHKVDYQKRILAVPKGKELNRFLFRLLQKYHLKLPPGFLEILQENYREDFDLLVQEVRKLSLTGGSFQKEEILSLLKLQANIFVLFQSLLNKNYLNFLRHFYKYLQQARRQEEIFKLISFLANSLWRVAIYKTNPKAKLKGNPYYLNELRSLAAKISYTDLQKILASLAKADRKLKRFQIKMEDFPREVIGGLIVEP